MSLASSCEIAVVGGGLVGMVTALLLAQAGREVVLVDPLEQSPPPIGRWDLRSFALTRASHRILAHCGVWSALDAARIARFEGMEIWEASGPTTLSFDPALVGGPPLAYLLEHANLRDACRTRLAAEARIADLAGQIRRIEDDAGGCRLAFDGGRALHARAVLACDGSHSTVREQCGFHLDERPYGQTAVVANVRTALPHAGIARQKFLASGPLAFLPLPAPDESAVVWTTTPAQADWALACTDEAFQATLEQAFDGRLGEVLSTSARRTFPLVRRHAFSYARGRVALLGEAAHVIHPLAGQGLNLGLLDAAVMAECLGSASAAAIQHPQSRLQRYARRRRPGNLAMLLFTEQLNHLFAGTHPAIGRLRRWGLGGISASDLMRRWVMAHAVGDRGDLPAIARPALALESL